MILPIAKILYSAGLVVVAGLFAYLAFGLLREVGRVWFDGQTYLVDFDFDEGGETSPSKGRWLTGRFQSHLKELEQVFRKPPAIAGMSPQQDNRETFNVDEPVQFGSSESPLAKLQLNWQGIDFGGILVSLRNWAWRPETLTASISRGADGETDAVLKWSNAASLQFVPPRGLDAFFEVRGRPDPDRAAFDLACRVFWLNAAAKKKVFQDADPDAFCEWAWLNSKLRDLRFRATQTAQGLSRDDAKALLDMRADADRLIALDTDFALAFRLRADIIGLIPDERKSEGDREIAVADVATYGLLIGDNTAIAAVATASITTTRPPDRVGVALPMPADLDAVQLAGILAPGLPLVSGDATVPFITAGPIVTDKNGDHFIVLPGYALPPIDASQGPKQGLAASIKLVSGEIVGDFVPAGDAGAEEPIALVKLLPDVKFANEFPLPNGRSFVINKVATPALGESVVLLRSSFFIPLSEVAPLSRQEAKVVSINGKYGSVGPTFDVTPAISGPGLGGAPILNARGELLGIAYAGSAKSDTGPGSSTLLELGPILTAKELTLATADAGVAVVSPAQGH